MSLDLRGLLRVYSAKDACTWYSFSYSRLERAALSSSSLPLESTVVATVQRLNRKRLGHNAPRDFMLDASLLLEPVHVLGHATRRVMTLLKLIKYYAPKYPLPSKLLPPYRFSF